MKVTKITINKNWGKKVKNFQKKILTQLSKKLNNLNNIN